MNYSSKGSLGALKSDLLSWPCNSNWTLTWSKQSNHKHQWGWRRWAQKGEKRWICSSFVPGISWTRKTKPKEDSEPGTPGSLVELKLGPSGFKAALLYPPKSLPLCGVRFISNSFLIKELRKTRGRRGSPRKQRWWYLSQTKVILNFKGRFKLIEGSLIGIQPYNNVLQFSHLHSRINSITQEIYLACQHRNP